MSFEARAGIIISVVATLSVISGTAVANDLARTVAPFTYDPCVVCAAPGDVVFFNGNYSTSTTGTILSYTWNFGDGTPFLTTNSPSTTHMYPGLPGKWQVTLTVRDSNRQTDTVSQLVIFNVAPRFTLQPANPETGHTITFNSSSTSIYFQYPQPPKEFLWNFGDGSNATGTIVERVYYAGGVYRVTLSVITADGNVTVSKTITVSPDPPIEGGGGRRAITL